MENPIALQIERPPTLSDTVTDAIRESIFRGGIPPGEPLREVALAESLDVSRITVREALRRLHEEGLVEIYSHKGAFVTQLSAKRAREVYSFRALVEPFAVRLALEAGAYGKGDLDRLALLAERLGRLAFVEADAYETAAADIEFHRLVCCRAGHDLLMEALGRLQSLTWLFLLNTRFYDAPAYLEAPSHLEVCQTIESGDPVLAGETLRQHIEGAGLVLLGRMEGRADVVGNQRGM
jgi:DNA-binding GntR family transcriptional regulator